MSECGGGGGGGGGVCVCVYARVWVKLFAWDLWHGIQHSHSTVQHSHSTVGQAPCLGLVNCYGPSQFERELDPGNRAKGTGGVEEAERLQRPGG